MRGPLKLQRLRVKLFNIRPLIVLGDDEFAGPKVGYIVRTATLI